MQALVLGDSFTGGGQSVLDITRAAKILGWKPKVDLKEGLRLTHARIKGK